MKVVSLTYNIESLRFAEDLKHFVAKAIKNGRNLYVVYKFFDKLDD